MKVAVVGASTKPDRYSNRAVRMLREYRHDVIPVHPAHREVEGLSVASSLDAIEAETVDTVTLYVSARHSAGLATSLVRLKPRRVIFNPGAENPALSRQLEERGVETIEACTLVMLRTGQF